METFKVTAELRTDKGKGASRRLRRAGRIPAVLYGAGKEAVSLSILHSEMIRHLEEEAFYSHILTLDVDGKAERAVLKDLQRHHFKPAIMHADFQRVSEDQKLHMHVPLHFLNESNCVGVKTGGGAISHHMVEVEITCLPKDLPEYIEVELIDVEVGGIIHLSDLKTPEGVELSALAHGNDLPVVTVHKGHGGGEEEAEGEEGGGTEES